MSEWQRLVDAEHAVELHREEIRRLRTALREVKSRSHACRDHSRVYDIADEALRSAHVVALNRKEGE